MDAGQVEAWPSGVDDRAGSLAATAVEALSGEGPLAIASASASGSFTADLGRVRWVSGVDIAWHGGDLGAIPFAIELSRDGVAYTPAFAGASSGTSLGVESYDVTDVAARHVRVTWTGSGAVPPVGIADIAVVGNAAAARDMWVWNSQVITDPAQRTAFFVFAVEHAVETVYVPAGALLASQPAVVAAFCQEAAGYGLGVELLLADHTWARASRHASAIAAAQQAVAFALAQPPDARPRGLHFDVEPHTLPEWTTDYAGIAGQYVGLLESLAGVTSGTGLRLTVDIAFWYDSRELTRDGVTRKLHEWVLDHVDHAVLMDYRDFALTASGAPAPDGTIVHAQTEVAYAGTVGKKVSLGLETKCFEDLVNNPEKITFCEEGRAHLELVLEQTRQHFAGHPGFAGMVIHHYATWRALGP